MNVAASEVRSRKKPHSPEAVFNRHMAKVSDQIAARLDITFKSNPFRTLGKRVAIAASARSGSSLLCQSLQAHGGIIQEFFHLQRIDREIAVQPITSLEQYLEAIFKEYAIGGTFGIKGALAILAPMMLAKEMPDFAAEWRFVYLKRTDALKQAISHYIADLTGSWRSGKAGREMTDDDFDGERIAFLANGHRSTNTRWEEAFDLLGIKPLCVTYEELSADTEAVAARAAAFLGLDGPPVTDKRFLAQPLEVQANAFNARWEARFLEEGWQTGEEGE